MATEKRELSDAIKNLIRFAAIFVIVTAVILLIISVYKTEKITVDGLNYYTEEAFLSKISSEGARKNTLLFRVEQFRNGQKKIPYIEHYDVVAEGNNVIRIQVYEKILVGCVKVMGQYLYFDKDGLVTESGSELLPGIPLIKGLEFDRIVLYETLKIQKDELYDVILNITKLVQEYNIPADSITFDGKGEVEMEVLGLTISLGKRNAYNVPLQKFADMFSTIKDRKLYIDLSEYQGGDGDIVAKPKED